MKRRLMAVISIMIMITIFVTSNTFALVVVPVKGITLQGNNISLKVGQTFTIKPGVIPSNAQRRFVYASSSNAIATVSDSGTIKGVKEGKAIITVSTPDKKVSTKCTVNVVSATIKPVEISYLNTSGLDSGIQQDPVAKQIFEKKFGLKINFIAGGDKAQEKLSAYMASGELPDVSILDPKQIEIAIKGNLIQPLDNAIKQYAPNISNNFPAMIQYMKDSNSAKTGKLYGLTTSIGSQTDRIGWHQTYYVRWDLYKKLGMPKVATNDQFLELAKKMQALEPKNSQGKKNYPFSIWADWDVNSMVMVDYVTADNNAVKINKNNGTLSLTEYDLKTGTLKSCFDLNSEYMKGLNFFYKANKMGLLDPDSLTQKFDAANSKLVNEGRILTAFWGWMAGSYNAQESRAQADTTRRMVPIAVTQEARFMELPDRPAGDTRYIKVIGKKSKYADRILSLLDYSATVEGSITFSAGLRGTAWDYVNGQPQLKAGALKDLVERPQSDRVTRARYGTGYYDMAMLNTNNLIPGTKTPITWTAWPATVSKNNQIEATNSKAISEWKKAFNVKSNYDFAIKNLKTVKDDGVRDYTMSPPDNIKTIQQKIGEICKKYSWKMVYAKSDAEFESLKKEMISKVNSLGYSKCYEWAKTEAARAKKDVSKYKEYHIN